MRIRLRRYAPMLLVLLASSCSTPVKVIETAPPPEKTVPEALKVPPPPANFLESLLNFLSLKQLGPTK